jgi:DNA replication ATP-dependent helicase Dna2
LTLSVPPLHPPSVPLAAGAPLRLTGTVVAQYFRSRCERQLRYDLVPAALRGGDVPRDNADAALGPLVGTRPGMELLARAGRAWERRKLRALRERLGPERVLAAGWDGNGEAKRLPYDDVVLALRNPGTYRYLVQPELRLADPAPFLHRHGIDPSRLDVAASRPDLVRIRMGADGRPRLGIADVKWSREAGIPHFAQVAFYSLLLEEVCRAEGIDAVVERRRGWIWSRGSARPRAFALAAYRHHVREFMRGELARAVGSAPADAPWHLVPACAGCRYFAHCRGQADAADDLARVAGITPLAKQVLAGRGVTSVKSLGTALLRRDTFTGAHALEANETALRQRTQAVRWGKVFDVEGRTRLMGGGESIRVLASAEADPVTGTVFALGLRIDRPGRKAEEHVFLSGRGTAAGERAMLAGFLDRASTVAVEAAAAALGSPAIRGRRNGASPGSLRFFVWDRGELEHLRSLVARHVGDPEVGPAVAAVADALLPRSNGAASPGAPGTVLLDAVADLFALPVPYAYDLAAVSDALRPAADAHAFHPPDDHVWTWSSQVAFERIHDLWRARRRTTGQGTADGLESGIRAVISDKLSAMDSVVRAVRERAQRRGESRLAGEDGFVPAPGGAEPIADPSLESLRLFVQMEAAAEALEVRALHALPARDRARRFECIRGMELVERRADGKLVFEFDPDCREAKFRPGDFALVLTNEDTDGLVETDRKPWLRRKLMVELVEYDLASSPPRVVLSPSGSLASAERDGQVFLDRRCVLDRASTDFNSHRLVATLRRLDAGDGEAAAVLDLLHGRTPAGFPTPVSTAGGEALLADASVRLGRPVLNNEQERARRAVFDNACSVIWGPPGTGKTYLLAWTLLTLAASARAEGRPLRVLVTSATHRAVVNVLTRMAREVESSGIAWPLRAVKLEGAGSEADRELEGTSVEVIEDARLPALLDAADASGEPIVVGGTVWSAWKQMRAANTTGRDEDEAGGDSPVRPWFDVVVIDEASQVKVPDALIALSSLRPGGRVVLCGDDRQLAPVVRGSYGREGDTLFGSAFTHFAGHFRPQMLRESRRMNAALVEYPRALFYPGLVSVVPRERLAVADACPSDDETDRLLWDLVFRPDDAVVLCTYSGYAATARNPFEAALAARIARLARTGLRDPATGAAFTADRFKAEALAVLSPHRAQNSAILGELASGGWRRDELPVVDTVERMQGNEREMIVVSYAVADGEYAEREAEFLLNPNRFNVSITRARRKLVVLMSEAVLRALPRDERVMADSIAVKGYPAHCTEGVRRVLLPARGEGQVEATIRARRLRTR